MFHHDGRDYDVAVGEAAAKGRVKMEEIIHSGMASAERVVAEIQSRVIQDRIAPAQKVRLHLDEEGTFKLALVDKVSESGGSYSVSEVFPIHDHAADQLYQNVGMPKKYAEYLAAEAGGMMWGKELVERNVNDVLAHRKDQRNLLRHEGTDGLLKGFLSDKFRRIDSRPLLDAFMGTATELGLVPVQGVASDTKVRLRAIMPQVFEPVANEVMLFGVEWGNSDYGDGGHVVNLFSTRVWCTNMAMMETALRQVHLGKTLSDDIQYSHETYRKDTELNVSALRDVVKHVIGPAKVNTMLKAITAASKDEIKSKDGIDGILKKHLLKNEAAAVKGLFEGPDVVNLPAGNTTWRLSNALSFFAQAKGVTPDRKLELEKLAGNLIPYKGEEAVAV